MRTSRELVAKVLNMLKNFMRLFFRQNMSQDCRVTVVRQSFDVHASVANMSPRNFGKFTMRKFRDSRTLVVRMPYDSRATVLATIWRENKTKRHSYCDETTGKQYKQSVSLSKCIHLPAATD